MAKKFGECVNIHTELEHEGGKGVARAVKGHLAKDAGPGGPLVETMGEGLVGGEVEDVVGGVGWLAHKGESLGRDVEILLPPGLALPEGDAREAAEMADAVPGELLDVAASEASEAGEDEGVAEARVGAGSGGEAADLVEREEDALSGLASHGG